MNNRFSGFAGQILSNFRNIRPKVIEGRHANIRIMLFKRHGIIENNTKIIGKTPTSLTRNMIETRRTVSGTINQ